MHTIGVMIGNANSDYTIETLSGIYEAARQSGVNVVCFAGVQSSYFYKEFYDKKQQEDLGYQSTCIFDYDKLFNIDALIVAYSSMSIFMSDYELRELELRHSGTPIVYLENETEGNNSRYVYDDSKAGIKQLMNHLIKDHGYRKILFLSGPKDNYDAKERLSGYKEAMFEAGLPFDNTMIAYGKFNEDVEEHINRLLDLNPDADAICCANDLMALCSYPVIFKRKEMYDRALKIGDKEAIEKYRKYLIGESSEHSIAVTGYDNTPDTSNATPPLTTINQRPYINGYTALITAIGLIDDPKNTKSTKTVPNIILRQSCGCKFADKLEFPALEERYILYPEQYSATISEVLINIMIPIGLYDTVSDEAHKIIDAIILKNVKSYLGLSDERLNDESILADVKSLMESPIMKYVPVLTFLSAINDLFADVLCHVKKEPDREILIKASSKVSDYIYSCLYAKKREEHIKDKYRTWFMPLISREMEGNIETNKNVFRSIISKVNTLELGDVYLFLADEPIINKNSLSFECPDELRLVASSENGKVNVSEFDEAIIVSRDNVINNYINSDNQYAASVMTLYSGESHYGIIVAKSKPEDGVALYCMSVQISTTLKFLEMARKQAKLENELENLRNKT